MKRFLAGFALPASAALALIGSGFSVWYFGNEKSQSEDAASMKATQLVMTGTFAQAKSSTLVFDQTKATRGETNVDFEANGIYFEGFDGDVKDQTITYTSNFDEEKNHTDHVDGKVNLVKKTSIYLPIELKDIIGMDGATKSDSFNEVTLLDNATKLNSTSYVEYVYTWGNDETTISLPTAGDNSVSGTVKFAFNYTNEPKNADEYDTFYATLKNITNKVYVISTAELIKA